MVVKQNQDSAVELLSAGKRLITSWFPFKLDSQSFGILKTKEFHYLLISCSKPGHRAPEPAGWETLGVCESHPVPHPSTFLADALW